MNNYWEENTWINDDIEKLAKEMKEEIDYGLNCYLRMNMISVSEGPYLAQKFLRFKIAKLQQELNELRKNE